MPGRNSITKVIFSALVFLTASVSSPASTPGKMQSRLENILADAVRAVGTKSAVENIESIHAYAQCIGPKGAYTTRIASMGSNKVFIQRTFEYREKPSNIKINGLYGWNMDSDPFSPEIISPFEKMVNRLHEYQRMVFDFRTMFSGFELSGEEDFFGSPSFKVTAKSEIGWRANLYFDKQRKILSGFELHSPDGTKVTNRFDQWRVIDEVNLPVKITAIDSQGEWVLNFKHIEFNSVGENVFRIPPAVRDKVELLKLHKQAETAHLTYDAELFVSMFDEELTQIQAGEVVKRDKSTNLERFKKYFATFKFDEWANIVPPVIRISHDGSLATVQVQKRVTGKYTDEEGKVHLSETIFAWLEVWEKTDGTWKVVTVASTRK